MISKNQLEIFYTKIHPTDDIYDWLKIDQYREISFQLNNEIYSRYNTFNNKEEFKKKIIKELPLKIDIGAIYEKIPESNKENIPLKKELVFDIDVTDYNRTCCNSKILCERYFLIIKSAIHILNYSLKEEFGFKKLKFIFSGGRGVHCWVSDKIAMNLNNLERSSIVNFYNEVNNNSKFPNEYKNILINYLDYFDNKPSDNILFDSLFLKLDQNVTKDIKHLLKAPFCIHPNTHNLCVPIDPNNLNISLRSIPNILDVLDDFSIINPYVDLFRK